MFIQSQNKLFRLNKLYKKIKMLSGSNHRVRLTAEERHEKQECPKDKPQRHEGHEKKQ